MPHKSPPLPQATADELRAALIVVKGKDYSATERTASARALIDGLGEWLARADLTPDTLDLPETGNDEGKLQVLLEYVEHAFRGIADGHSADAALGRKRSRGRPAGGFPLMEESSVLAALVELQSRQVDCTRPAAIALIADQFASSEKKVEAACTAFGGIFKDMPTRKLTKALKTHRPTKIRTSQPK